MKRNILAVPVLKIHGASSEKQQDLVAVEEPLEIRIGEKPVSVTMRTPGHDAELAIGFLFGEGIVRHAGEIEAIELKGSNRVTIRLQPGINGDDGRLERNFYMSSSCGICGKASIEAVHAAGCSLLARDGFTVSTGTIHGLPKALRETQIVFDRTGGLHGAALFDAQGTVCSVREDVGRHNAVDKLIGNEVISGHTPLVSKMLLVSGRASFELIQKAVMAGIPIMCAVGAPSSLAVELARRFQMTLLGFVRDDRFNIYSGDWRVI